MCVSMCVCIVYCVHHRVNRLLVALADEPVNVAKQVAKKEAGASNFHMPLTFGGN